MLKQPPRLSFETSRLFKFHAKTNKPTTDQPSPPSQVANSDSTSHPPTIDSENDLIKRPSWNSLSSGKTVAESIECEDFEKLDLDLYPTSKETVEMIQQSLGLLSRRKTCLKTHSLVQELFAFVAENSSKETKTVGFANPIVTESHSLDDYYRLQMTRKIKQLDLIEDKFNDERDTSLDTIDSADECSPHDPEQTMSNIPPTSAPVLIKDEEKWLDRDSPDEDTFGVSSSDSSFGSEEIVKDTARLKRTKRFIKDEGEHSGLKSHSNLYSVNDIRSLSTVTPVLQPNYASYYSPSSSASPALNSSYYSPSSNASYYSPSSNASYYSPALNASYYSPALKLQESHQPNHKYKHKKNLEPSMQGINTRIEGYYCPRIQQCYQSDIKPISLCQSMEVGSDQVPVTQLSDGGSPRIIKKTMPGRSRFGGRVKEILNRWF
jgi:hypothetical protein